MNLKTSGSIIGVAVAAVLAFVLAACSSDDEPSAPAAVDETLISEA